MIESEHNATSDDSPPASNAPRSVKASLVVPLLIAAAFLASDWFFYQQGYTAKEISLLPAVGLTVKGVEAVLFRLTRYVREKLGAQDSRSKDLKTND